VGKPHRVEFRGRLPSAPDLPKLYERWQTAYYRWGANHRWWRASRIDFPAQTTNVSHWDDCTHAAQALENGLSQWFSQPDLRDLREEILIEVRRQDYARLILQTQDPWLRRLPWHLWSLLERLPKVEIGMSAHHAETARRLSSPVKILAVLGNSEGLDLQVDWALLETLPQATVERLVEPTRQALSDRLFDHPWDILFFAGHSRSEVNGETGYVWINASDRLTPNELRYALSQAVRNGLQLAIFNSCDGLGLARELADLQIPHLIVMREPVPDRIAQLFLQYFLKAFAQGDSLHLAVRQAREQLQSMETTFPCASWLPVLCQNPAASSLQYPRYNLRQMVRMGIAGAIALSSAVLLLQKWWQAEQIHARISSGEKVLVTSVTNADKVAGVSAFKQGDFDTAVTRFERALQQDHNDPETRIYLNNARIAGRPALKIAVSVPIGSNPNVAQEILRGVAQAQDGVNQQGGIAAQTLKIEIANDDNDPGIAKLIATHFVDDRQLLAVIGHNASDASVAAAPVYIQGGLVMITPTSFSDQLSSMGAYVFRMVPSIRFLADKLATDYIKTYPTAQIAICSDSAAVDNESYRNQFANGVLAQKIAYPKANLVQIPCDFSAKNFDPNREIASLLNQGVDTLLLAPHIDRISKATDIARASQGRLKLLGSTSLHTATTLELGQDAVNGLLLSVPWHPAMVSNQPFSRKSAKLWGGAVNWRTAMAYDATQVVIAGLQQAIATGSQASATRDGIKDALRSSNFSVNGASGTIRFIQSGERQIVPSFGVLVQVKPAPGSQFGYDFVPRSSNKK
jgi:branched-chain amino acid transport system substrate-binding protein